MAFTNGIFKKFKHLSLRQKIQLVLFSLAVILGFGVLIWATATGRIRPFAAGNQISNTAQVTYVDINGATHTASSNTVTTEVTTSPSPSQNLSFTLQLEGPAANNLATTGLRLKIFPSGSTSATIDLNNVSIDSTGHGQVDVSSLSAGNYDLYVKAPNYLSRTTRNVSLPTTQVDLGLLKAGDINLPSPDDIVNSLDFSRINGTWNQDEPTSDLNRDHIVNTIDFSLLNRNWFQSGQ